MKSIVLGGGCFWCIEAVYQRVRGVESVTSGYAGGEKTNPTYNDHGNHAEVVKIKYDESVVSLEKLLEIFFYVHDPTTLNRQGADVGEQYRSIILCEVSELEIAQKSREAAQKLWNDPIVTDIKVLETFYPAENYHQNYYNNNQSAGYCQVVINPKLAKFESKFGNYVYPIN
jgi:peptide-methionine (S)-S-oxide reductase